MSRKTRKILASYSEIIHAQKEKIDQEIRHLRQLEICRKSIIQRLGHRGQGN